MRAHLWSSVYDLAERFYGQLRGYGRWSIRAQAAASVRLAPEILHRQQKVAFQQRVWQAIQQFPAYADKVRRHCGQLPEASEAIEPEALPIWTRDDQRALFQSLNPADYRGCFLHSTGGSSGQPIRFYMTRHSYEWRRAVSLRGYSWAEAQPGIRTLYVWSDPAVTPPLVKRMKIAAHALVERRRHFSCFYFSRERQAECCQVIDRYRPHAIVAYASKLAELAAFVRENPGRLKWRTPHLVTGAEALYPPQRKLIEEYLGGVVQISYGSREFMLIGMECPRQTGYHLSEDNLLVEVVDESGKPSAPGEPGRILVTDLNNAANPFVRYELGDLGTMAPAGERCPCGLPFRRLLHVDGRMQDQVLATNGARLTAIFFPHNLKEFPWIDRFQVHQSSQAGIELRLITPEPLQADRVAAVRRALQPALGADSRIEVVRVEQLEQAPNGKIPMVISTVKD